MSMICNINLTRFRDALDNFQVRDTDFSFEENEDGSMTVVAGGNEYEITLYSFKFDGHLTMGNGGWDKLINDVFKTATQIKKNKKILEKTNMGDSYNG